MKSQESTTSIIKEIAVNYFADADVMLFGSRVKGMADDESDYDVLIITNHFLTSEEKTPLRTQIRKELLIKGIRTDILIQSRDEIEKKKNLPGHFIRNILKEAIIL
jgi:predicted nucleotidyltransferase